MEQAMFWEKAAEGKIECGLCPHHCRIAEGRRGICGVREARAGKLLASGYGKISSANNDPIEKKPLYHFHPGATIFSIGGWGCNFKCRFCQNWSISQQFEKGAEIFPPDKIIAAAANAQSTGIAYTYNEPLINIEFVAACARLAREASLVNVLVTNGYIEREPAEYILPLVDALNIDIKGMEEKFYKEQCSASLKPVLEFSQQSVEAGRHVEITNLIIPGLNDSEEQIKKLADWIRKNLGEKTPLHLSAYHPEYKLDRPPTPPATLERAHDLCREKLTYVYIGNVFSDAGQNTICPQCGHMLVIRRGYSTKVSGLEGKNCAKCGRTSDLVMGT